MGFNPTINTSTRGSVARANRTGRFEMATAARMTIEPVAQFASDVRAGLCKTGQKDLPSKYLYDPFGFPRFEGICQLTEYGLTRAAERLLRRHSMESVRHVPSPALVSELGSGSGRKTRWILRALCEREPVSYYRSEERRVGKEGRSRGAP